MLNYKSADGYFDITERKKYSLVEVTHLFSTPIFGINNFITRTVFNSKGYLLYYTNSLGDEIFYLENPVKHNNPPKILGASDE